MWMQISSGKGPEECELAVGLFLKTIMKENPNTRIIDSVPGHHSGTYKSVFLSIDPGEFKDDTSNMNGTILWICQSPYRPKHRRKNGFLNYTQAFILLGVPEEERAQFIAEIDVESMSTRELQKAVNDRNQAVKERDRALQEKADLQKALDDQVSQITQLTTERDNLKTKAEELRKSQAEIETKAGNLRSELSSIKQSRGRPKDE